jgi:hypothetical protein
MIKYQEKHVPAPSTETDKSPPDTSKVTETEKRRKELTVGTVRRAQQTVEDNRLL